MSADRGRQPRVQSSVIRLALYVHGSGYQHDFVACLRASPTALRNVSADLSGDAGSWLSTGPAPEWSIWVSSPGRLSVVRAANTGWSHRRTSLAWAASGLDLFPSPTWSHRRGATAAAPTGWCSATTRCGCVGAQAKLDVRPARRSEGRSHRRRAPLCSVQIRPGPLTMATCAQAIDSKRAPFGGRWSFAAFRPAARGDAFCPSLKTRAPMTW